MEFNEYQSTPEQLKLSMYPLEVQELFWDFVDNVPYIQYMLSKDRKRACDLDKDDKGRIIIDITLPHILEDMDYFRPSALHYKEHKCYTKLRPNPNPNSEYGKWIREEIRRCYEGYVRESDGEWITGNMYFFLNYCMIPITKTKEGSKKGDRVIDFPEVWEGIYYRFHYIEQALRGGLFNKDGGRNGCEISSRGKSKSLTMAAIMAKYFVLGESLEVCKNVKSMAVAYQKQFLVSDGILNKFESYIDFIALNTQFPSKRLKSSILDMTWKMGYVDLDTGTVRGTQNETYGVSVKDDVSKVRGKRLNFIVVEEFGSFKHVLELYNIMMPSIKEGEFMFGFCYLIGTAGDDDSDFQEALEIVYNPDGYSMYSLPNKWDKEGLGKRKITFFFPGYLNMKGCYDSNGNSDVTKALLLILENRYLVKYNSSDINTIVRTISEIPITPLEAILRSSGNMFPIAAINERISQIDNDVHFYDDTYIGELIMTSSGTVEFKPTSALPIRIFPTLGNKVEGALEIYEMPLKVGGKIPAERYIMSMDNYENDTSDTMSLGSIFVLDLWTDRIVAEYTGRPQFVDDLNEIARKMAIFFNAKIMYENNKKNTFSYFSKMNALHLLADVPEYLRNKVYYKTPKYGNTSKGITATAPVKNFGFQLIRNWLLKPVVVDVGEGDNLELITLCNISFVKNRALLKELALYNPSINVDRIMSMVQLMLYREEKMIIYNGNPKKQEVDARLRPENDPFFLNNYDNRF